MFSDTGATKFALDIHNIEVCNVRIGADYFIGKRDYTRTVSFPHPKGECCICGDDSGLKMKCGHYICPDDILDCAWAQLKTLKHQITCATCTTIIDIDDVIKFGLPSEEEKQFLTTALSVNFCSSQDIQQCLNCKSYCQRQNTDNPQVTCLVCTNNTGTKYLFCWCCLRKWKNAPANYQNCGNVGCNKDKTDLLQAAPLMEFKDMNQRKVNVPMLRACPGCKSLVDHEGGCNSMTCKFCGFVFCFICLTPMTGGSLICKSTTWDPEAPINCTPAPLQKLQ